MAKKKKKRLQKKYKSLAVKGGRDDYRFWKNA